MDDRFRSFYEEELQHIRDMGREFGAEFPDIAGRLAIDSVPCPDPYVERLLEGFAYFSARTRLRLDNEFPRFSQTLLDAVYPHYLSPTPSMTVAQFQIDANQPALVVVPRIPRGTPLRSRPLGERRTVLEYRTAHDVRVAPLVVLEAEYLTRDIGKLSLKVPAGTPPIRAGLRLRISCPAAPSLAALAPALKELDVYLADRTRGGRLYEQLFAHCTAVVARPIARPLPAPRFLPPSVLSPLGFESGEALLPHDERSFQGYRLLQEFFAMPERLLFFRVGRFDELLAECNPQEMDLMFLFSRADPELEDAVVAEDFQFNCTPAINLFSRHCDRIFVTDKTSEHRVVVDRTRPLDFEVFRINGVAGFTDGNEQVIDFEPFFSARDTNPLVGGYYAVNRTLRRPTDREQKAGRVRASYAGSDVSLMMVDSRYGPFLGNVSQIGVDALVTNRDLPIQFANSDLAPELFSDSAVPIKSIRCIRKPTLPRPSAAEAGAEFGKSTRGDPSWRLISHLSLNYLSLVDSSAKQGASTLREMLELYATANSPEQRRLIDGVRSASSKGIVQPIPAGGTLAFVRGIEISLTLEDEAFRPIGPFLLASVLEQFFARYVTTNSFTRLSLSTLERGEIKRWPARLGNRPAI